MIVATKEEIDVRVNLRNEIIALKRANESLREAHQAEVLSFKERISELDEELDNAKRLIATLKSANKAWQENAS